jgi:aspartyl/asparaginyl beta-hydroxylase (cupin superfamily)
VCSVLDAHTHIPPHTGSTNARALVHLPLVLPGPARFRVGHETRDWRMGQAWVFDDTIEHEAWNDADTPRAILIADVWNPYLDDSERALAGALMAGRRDYYRS